MSIEQLRTRLDRAWGQRKLLRRQIASAQERLSHLQEEQENYTQASAIFSQVCRETQMQVQDHLSNLVSLAMSAVFDHPYNLLVEFVQRRGKTECDLSFERDGSRLDPMASSGYGAVDVAGFALRVAVWFLGGRSSRPVFVLDEPFKHLKGLDENRRLLSMIRTMTRDFGIQVITVSDERVPRNDTITHADKVFEVFRPHLESEVRDVS